MAKRARTKSSAPEPCELIVQIERYEQAYYISEHGRDGREVSDEALIEIRGRVVAISQKLKRHLNERLDVHFACATSFSADEPTPVSDKPFLLPVILRKDRRGFMAYLPAAAFWEIPRMIDLGRLTHIEARFNPPHHGSGGLLGVYLIPESKLESLVRNGEEDGRLVTTAG